LDNKTVSVKVNLKKYSLDAVRYAAYAMSGEAFVHISVDGRDTVSVALSPKGGGPAAPLKARFQAELADEALREKTAADNRELREFLTLKALSAPPPQPARQDSGLTPEQEKELADLISQVEKEIKEDSRGAAADPLGLTSTWEDKYGAKKQRKK
jgi:His-Xaa-Ser system protein HxsD